MYSTCSSHYCTIHTHTHTHTPQLGSPFRDPVMKFALKFPQQTVEFFLTHLAETSISSLFHFFLEHDDGRPLRDTLAKSPDKIIAFTFAVKVSKRYRNMRFDYVQFPPPPPPL